MADLFFLCGNLLFQHHNLPTLFRAADGKIRCHLRVTPAAIDRGVVIEGKQAVIVAPDKGIKLVVMAARTDHRGPHPEGCHRLHLVEDIIHTILLSNTAPFTIDHVVAVKAGGQHLLFSRVGQEIPRQLLNGKLVIRHVRIQGAHHPVAPRPHGAFAVALITVAVGISRGLQPIPRHPLAVTRTGQKPVHHHFKCLRRFIL